MRQIRFEVVTLCLWQFIENGRLHTGVLREGTSNANKAQLVDIKESASRH